MGYPKYLEDWGYEVNTLMRERGMYAHARLELPEDPSEPRYAPPRTITNPSFDAERVAYIHSEASELLDKLRDGDDEGARLEAADIILRTLDFAHHKGWNMDQALVIKMNEVRERVDQRPAAPGLAK